MKIKVQLLTATIAEMFLLLCVAFLRSGDKEKLSLCNCTMGTGQVASGKGPLNGPGRCKKPSKTLKHNEHNRESLKELALTLQHDVDVSTNRNHIA